MRKMARALALTLLSLTLVTGVAAPAFADGIPPVIGGGGTTPGQPGTPPPGGGGGTPPTPPEGYQWVYGGFPLSEDRWTWNNGLDGEGSGGIRISGACQPRTLPGDNKPDHFATSVSWSYLLNPESGAVTGYSYSCWFPPAPEDFQVRCADYMQATLTKQKSVFEHIDTVKRASGWSTDRDNFAKCGESLTAYVDGEMKPLGAYLVQVEGRTFPCTARKYFDGRGTVIRSCGNAAVLTKTVKGAIWCGNGGIDWAIGPDSWGNHTFTWAECADEYTDLIDCQLDAQAPRFAGRRADDEDAPVQVMDDGKTRPLSFAPFNPTGVVEVLRQATQVVVDRDSTPYWTNRPVDSNDQAFWATDGFGTVEGDRTVWQTAFAAAGNAGAPWNAYKRVYFDAKVRATTVTIEQIDFETMQVTTSARPVVVTATDISCVSPRAYVDVHRARNASR